MSMINVEAGVLWCIKAEPHSY